MILSEKEKQEIYDECAAMSAESLATVSLLQGVYVQFDGPQKETQQSLAKKCAAQKIKNIEDSDNERERFDRTKNRIKDLIDPKQEGETCP